MSADRKVVTLEQLMQIRARGVEQTIVHCHGCFDIVHPGHIHHLQYAKSLGDVLVVSVSADEHVNKGVDRPLIPDDLRVRSLAALECVDAVYLNPQSTAVDLLDQLKPDIYVKGREYENNFDPRFLAERQTVARNGGRVVFSTNDIVYSSTALINGLAQKDHFADEKLRRYCGAYNLDDQTLGALLHRFRGQRVAVIGDYLLDRYHFCDATGVAGEAPMMALRAISQRDYDGGAAIIAAHLSALGAMPTLITALGDDDLSHQVEMRLRAAGVMTEIVRSRRAPALKQRYLVDDAKVLKVDVGGPQPLDSRQEDFFVERVLTASEGAAAVIFADFGYGLISGNFLDRVMPRLRSTVPVITADVSGRHNNLTRFTNVDLLCPTEREAREAVGDFSSGLGAVAASLLSRTQTRQALITLGRQGLVTFDDALGQHAENGRLRSEYLPALSTQSIDPLGAGDALLAAASLTLAVGGSLHAAALLGSFAAACEVQQLGNVAVSSEQLSRAIRARDFTCASQLRKAS